MEATTAQPPALKHSLTEVPRAARETFGLLFSLKRLAQTVPHGNGQPVLTLPGYGANDGSMVVMRRFLKKIGYNVFSLQAGRNFEPPEERIMSVDDATRFREKMVAIIGQRLQAVFQQTQQKVALVGWSMGGCYALDLSQQYPECVSQVITLGTPFGDPRGTAAWKLMRKINKSQVPIETMDFKRWLDKTHVNTTGVAINVLFSETDGIVNPEIAKLPAHPDVQHHGINASHVAFAYNTEAYKKIARLLHHHG